MMRKQLILKKFLATLITLSATISTSYALDKYVTDDVNVYLRRGPGAQYAFSGSVKAGDKVNILETSQDGKYARIQDAEGKFAWIETSKLNDTPSLKERFTELESQLAEYKNKADQANNADTNQADTIDSYMTKLQDAEQTIANLQKQIKEQNKQIDSMTTQVDEKRQNLIQTWFIYGGGVAGAGLLLGLILPMLIPNRRRKDRWMN
ncbi:TIGR04211 family SH3 domain-containing protein [Orbaceae bacterium ESL0727]|nr:TIGR04211 family SH3 domain-containing protein [Orbaceae bacterium ESL0727]